MLWINQVLTYAQTHGPALATRAAVAMFVGLAIFLLGRILSAGLQKGLARSKAEKLGPVLSSFVNAVAVVVAVLMALDQIGVNVTTLVAGAGVLGLAIGFGSQALVRDIISGFFIIFDGALYTGDIVKIGDVQGQVESVGLRITKVRSINGQLWFVPNGEVKLIGNFSRDWSRAIVEVGVAYEQDVKKGLEVLQKVAQQWAEENKDIVLEPPEAQGVLGLNSSDVGLRIIAKVKPAQHWAAERDLRARIKEAFDAQGVEIPFPRQVVYHRQEDGFVLQTASSETPS